MSGVSAKLEELAETHRVNVLVILEWFNERVAIMIADRIPESLAEELALEDVESELERGHVIASALRSP